MLKQQVLDTIKKNELIDYGDGIVVGISGGYDSVCLLHILYSISSEFGLKLYPVHINHMLRGQEAQRDEDFVKEFCTSLGLQVFTKKIDIAAKAQSDRISLEEAGRNARYEEFNRVAQLTCACKIAVAHSRNDQAETILMRIFRGTGPEGLKGIEYKRDNVIRPLLDADRLQIEDYVNKMGLKAITDSSNLHTDYFRNRIRLKVIPEINSAVGSDITEKLVRLSKIVVTDEDFLRYNSELYYKKTVKYKKDLYAELDLKELKGMHAAISTRVLRKVISDFTGSVNGLSYVHIEKLMQLAKDGRTGARIDLPFGVMAVKSYDCLIIRKQEEEQVYHFAYKLNIPGNTEIAGVNGVVSSQVINFDSVMECGEYIKTNKSLFTQFFDFSKLIGYETEMTVRTRENGDIFKPINSNGTKKLKEYFIDNKIPKNERHKFPLIAINKEIIWIIGNKTSDNYKVTDNTNSVLMISFTYNQKCIDNI